MWYWCMGGHIKQWDRIESRKNLFTHGQLIFGKDITAIQKNFLSNSWYYIGTVYPFIKVNK